MEEYTINVYDCILFFRRPETKREGNRKRTTSGPRPLSALGDGLDPFDLLGIERAQDGQVIRHFLPKTNGYDIFLGDVLWIFVSTNPSI